MELNALCATVPKDADERDCELLADVPLDVADVRVNSVVVEAADVPLDKVDAPGDELLMEAEVVALVIVVAFVIVVTLVIVVELRLLADSTLRTMMFAPAGQPGQPTRPGDEKKRSP